MANGCSIETLREKVCAHLKRMIKANRLSPGELNSAVQEKFIKRFYFAKKAS
jgi:hypothetical protein